MIIFLLNLAVIGQLPLCNIVLVLFPLDLYVNVNILFWMSDTPITFSIGDLAREFDLTTRTIRYYEDKNLLQPDRLGQQRVYSRADRTRLKLILRGKRLGWNLDEIFEVIQLYNSPDGEKRQLELMISKIDTSRKNLLDQQEDIKVALQELDEIEQRCQIQLRSPKKLSKQSGIG